MKSGVPATQLSLLPGYEQAQRMLAEATRFDQVMEVCPATPGRRSRAR
jgi:hypothetical protein